MTVEHHARLAPSSADIWANCPGSVAMQEAQPEQEETDESREGTAAHWLLAQILLKLTVPADAVAPNGVPINDEMREAVAEMVSDVNDTLKGCQPGDFYQIEQRVYAHKTIHPDNDGTPDVYFVQRSRKTVHIWDFKYGHGFVDAYRCLQLVNYAAAIVETEGIHGWQDWAFTFSIAQPRCYVQDELGGALREWFTDGWTLAPLFDKLRIAAQEASQAGAECRTGDQCRYCRAAWDCTANQRMGGRGIDLVFAQQSSGMNPVAVGLELAILDDADKRLTARRKALAARAQSLINSGSNVAYHRLDWTKPRTVWDKARQAEAAGLVAMFTEDVVQMGVALPTPAQCIKAGVDEAVIKPYTTKAPAAQKLVRVSDDSAAKVFGTR